MADQSQRFLFDNTDIRGELIQLESSYQTVLEKNNYPEPVKKLLGEFMVAAALLGSTLKFKGTLSLLCRSEGEIPLITAEANNKGELRAIAKDTEQAHSNDFKTLLKNGNLVITIDPEGGNRYQGIVPLDGNNLAESLEHYFMQSEQLATSLYLVADGKTAAGMLLQELPASHISPEERAEQWQHLTHLAATLKDEELLQLENETLLYRLYHQEQVRLFDPKAHQFKCSCSKERTAKAIKAIGQEEAKSIIAEQGQIDITCEFCHHQYQFTEIDVQRLFSENLH